MITITEFKPQRSESVTNLIAALCKFQSECPTIRKTRTATVNPRNGGRSYSYKYADIGDIVETIKEKLTEHGIFQRQESLMDEKGNVVGVYTELYHTSGEFIFGSPVHFKNAPGDRYQDVGSTITYARRYSLCMALGIVSDQDDDGNIAEGHEFDVKGNQNQRQKQQSVKNTKSGNQPAAQQQTPPFQDDRDKFLKGFLDVATQGQEPAPNDFDEDKPRRQYFAAIAKNKLNLNKDESLNLLFHVTAKGIESYSELTMDDYKQVNAKIKEVVKQADGDLIKAREAIMEWANEGAKAKAELLANQQTGAA